MCVFLISPVPITEPLTSELIDTPVFHNLAPRPIKYRVSVPIPSQNWAQHRITEVISLETTTPLHIDYTIYQCTTLVVLYVDSLKKWLP